MQLHALTPGTCIVRNTAARKGRTSDHLIDILVAEDNEVNQLVFTQILGETPWTFEIVGNKEVIAVDQDPLGKQGEVVTSEGGRWVVAKQMKDGSRAVALFNESGTAQRIATTAAAIGLPAAGNENKPLDLLSEELHYRGGPRALAAATIQCRNPAPSLRPTTAGTSPK